MILTLHPGFTNFRNRPLNASAVFKSGAITSTVARTESTLMRWFITCRRMVFRTDGLG